MDAPSPEDSVRALMDEFVVGGHVRRKTRSALDEWATTFIQHSPLFFLASGDGTNGVTVSPRGGSAGFVTVLSQTELRFEDRIGNALFESYRNILRSAAVSLIFVIPGINETLRLRGTATVERSTESTAADYTGIVITVAVTQCYYHCGRAMKLSDVWNISRIASHRSARPVPRRPAAP